MNHNYQTFNGVKFREECTNGYYVNNSVGNGLNPNVRMHTYVWEYYNGPVPDGYCVHHKDGNKGNNDITNLQLMSLSEHSSYHGVNASDTLREWRKNHMRTTVQECAKQWHKSEDGSKWHTEHIKQQHESGVFYKELVCSQCGKTYIGRLHKTDGNTFCGNNCKARYLRHKRSLDSSDNRVCEICGNQFTCSKWSGRSTCSKTCTNKLNWRNRKKK